MKAFLKVVCSGKCCEFRNSFTTGVLPGFLDDLGVCQGEKKKNVKTAAPDVVHVRKLSRYEGTLICGC